MKKVKCKNCGIINQVTPDITPLLYIKAKCGKCKNYLSSQNKFVKILLFIYYSIWLIFNVSGILSVWIGSFKAGNNR